MAIGHTYLFALTDGGGTVPPELGVARRLVTRGHRVTVLADESMAAQVQATGATLRTWMRRAPDELRDWEMKNAYPLPAPGMPPFGGGLAPVHGPLGRLRDQLANAGSTMLFDRYALKPIDSIRSKYGLEPVAHVWDQLHHARRQLVLTARAFDFPADLPVNVRYVGPILDDPVWAIDETWTPPAGVAPLVLVALSSTFQNQADCIQRIVDALATLPVRGLVTTGPTIPASALRSVANVRVVESAPHNAVLRSASLVITHGGHGTVIKTLSAGLPMVIMHHGRDQADNSRRVIDRGAGIAVSRGASADRIAQAVAEILASPAFRESAGRLGQAVVAEASSSRLLDASRRSDPRCVSGRSRGSGVRAPSCHSACTTASKREMPSLAP